MDIFLRFTVQYGPIDDFVIGPKWLVVGLAINHKAIQLRISKEARAIGIYKVDGMTWKTLFYYELGAKNGHP